MKKKNFGRRVMAAVIVLTMLLGSMTAFAAEKPSKSDAPTWQDVYDLMDYVDENFYSDDDSYEFLDIEDLSAEAPYFEQGKVLASSLKEQAYAMLVEDGTFDNPDGSKGDVTDLLTGDAYNKYSDLYDAGTALVESLTTATGEKYIEDIDPLLTEFWENYNASLDAKLESGQIKEIDIANGEAAPDTATMEKGTYWIDSADLTAYWTKMETTYPVADGWENKWEAHNGGPDIERSEIQWVLNVLTEAYNTLCGKLHEGTKTNENPADEKTVEKIETVEPKAEEKAAPEPEPVLINQVINSTGAKSLSKIEGVYGKVCVSGAVYTNDQAAIKQAAGLTEAEIKNGAVVKYYICESLNKNMNQMLAKSLADNGYKSVCIMNNDLYKLNKGVITKIKTTGEALTVLIGVPENLRNDKYEFVVMCYDESGKLVILPDLDTDKATITVQANNFGYWAVGYRVKA